jgi:hypothetical protein
MDRQHAKTQFERVIRSFGKMTDNRNRELVEYEDDVWHFFQDCWHLKEWIKNDDRIPKEYRLKVEADVARSETLRICADLANRSKQLKFDRRPRLDADVSKRNLTIHAGPPGIGSGQYDFIILLEDGREIAATAVAEAAMNEWRQLLVSYEVDVDC